MSPETQSQGEVDSSENIRMEDDGVDDASDPESRDVSIRLSTWQ